MTPPAVEATHAAWQAGLKQEAETCALLARAALVRRDIAAAVAHFRDGLQTLAPAPAADRWAYGVQAVEALNQIGNLLCSLTAIKAAGDLYEQILRDAPRNPEKPYDPV